MESSTDQEVSTIAAEIEPSDSTAGWTLDTLPTEVLQAIWIHLDDPASWALTNKHLRSVSQDVGWRAKWFIQRYADSDPLVKAFLRPKIWSLALKKQFLELGAGRTVISALDDPAHIRAYAA